MGVITNFQVEEPNKHHISFHVELYFGPKSDLLSSSSRLLGDHMFKIEEPSSGAEM